MGLSEAYYNFKITSSERIMYVFGTVMSHSDEGILVDLWCPEEPGLSQRIMIAQEDVLEAIKTMLRERMEQVCASEKPFFVQFNP